MSLKNVTREDCVKYGKPTWLLRDADGNPIAAYSHFCEKNLDYKFATQKRYAEVVAHFVDYLIEAKAFGVPVTKRHLNAVIDAYPILLRDGSSALCERLLKTTSQHPEDLWLLQVAQSLHQKPLKTSSFSNTLAAINRFLRLSEALAIEAFEKATLAGIRHNDNYTDLIDALSGSAALSSLEVRSMRENSVLGSVIRFKSEGLSRPRRLTSKSASSIQEDLHHLDFPFNAVLELAKAASSKRDKALWLLLAASGIRVSEALNLRWSDIDIQKQEVYVYDPEGRRFGGDMLPEEKLRFKGRTVSMTYLIQPFRQEFFKALAEYVKEEYVPPRQDVESNLVFQYVESTRRGQPLVGVSDASLNANFKSACARAGIAPPSTQQDTSGWTIHSLRHMYGVYMVNDFPVNPAEGTYGLELSEVQMLMGHKRITSTKHYARKKRHALERKLARADQHLLGIAPLALPSKNQENQLITHD